MNSENQKKQLKYQMKQHEMLANYWLAMATTGATTNRNVTDGYGRPYTDDELIQDALDTSLRHIHLHRECGEKLLETED